MNNDKQLYECKMTGLVSAVRNMEESVAPDAIMHALGEIAAQVAIENGMGFEDYVRCAMCAWDCTMERRARDIN